MEAETVVQGSWYRKSANSGYNHGKIVTDDYAEGEKALNLSITAGSTTTPEIPRSSITPKSTASLPSLTV